MFEELCNCEICPLRSTKAAFGCVPGEQIGGDPVETLWIGISPAKDELKKGRPMVGPSGTLGKAAAAKAGYEDYYITNSMLCWYPDTATTEQLEEAAECCRPRLEAEIEYFKPKLILTLGAFPMQQIIPEQPNIMSIEGRIQETKYGPIMPIRQPAEVLHNPEHYPDLEHSFRRGLDYVDGEYYIAGEPETVIVTLDSIDEICERIYNAEYAVIDLETTTRGFYPYAWEPDKIRCVAMAIDDKVGYIFPYALIHHPSFARMIMHVKGIYHNAQFDAAFLWQEGYEVVIYYDTILAHYLTDEREYTHSLKLLAGKFLGAPDWEGALKKYLPNKKASYDLIPDHVLYPYAARDVCYTWLLYVKWRDSVSATGPGVMATLMIPAANMFTAIRHNGIRIDVEKLMNMDSTLAQEAREAIAALREEVGFGLELTGQAVCKYLYDDLGLPIIKQFGRSSQKKVLAHYQDLEAVRLIVEARHALHMQSTYIMGVAKHVDTDFRIHPFINLFGTVTGRLITVDPSMMNVEGGSGAKDLYLPEEGHLMADADFSGIELRAYISLVDDQHLLGQIQDGLDLHEVVRAEVEEMVGQYVNRTQAKSGVFGQIYGRGIQSFMDSFRINKEQAQKVRDMIDREVPSRPAYAKYITDMVMTQGEVRTFFGRRRRFPYINDNNRAEVLRQAFNTPIQGTGTDVNLHTMLHMWDIRKETGATPMQPVHDSVLFDIVDEECAPILKEEMQNFATELMGGQVPYDIAVKIGRHWGEASGHSGRVTIAKSNRTKNQEEGVTV